MEEAMALSANCKEELKKSVLLFHVQYKNALERGEKNVRGSCYYTSPQWLKKCEG